MKEKPSNEKLMSLSNEELKNIFKQLSAEEIMDLMQVLKEAGE